MDGIRRDILSGRYPPGSRLPGRRRLAHEYGVASMTAGNAMREYARLGVLRIHPADGAFVTEDAPRILTGDGITYDLVQLADTVAALTERVDQLERTVTSLRQRWPGPARIPRQHGP